MSAPIRAGQPITWWTAASGDPIWFEMRGKWKPGTILVVGRKRGDQTIVTIKTTSDAPPIHRHVKDVRWRFAGMDGRDRPVDLTPEANP